MAVRYSGHLVQTRQQAVWMCAGLLAVLLPLAAWRLGSQSPGVALALLFLTLAPFALAYQCYRFLTVQEGIHAEPTDGMRFAFRMLASVPLTFGGLLFVLLEGLR